MSSRFDLSMLVAIFLLVSVFSAVAEEAEYAGMDEIIELLEYCSSSLPDCTYSQPEKIELENGETRYMAFIHSVELCGDTNIEVFNSYIRFIEIFDEAHQLWSYGDIYSSGIIKNATNATRHCYLLIINPRKIMNPFCAIFHLLPSVNEDDTVSLWGNNSTANKNIYVNLLYKTNMIYAITDSGKEIQIAPEKNSRDYNEYIKGFLAYIPILHIKNWNEMKMKYTNNVYHPTSRWAFHIEEDVNIDGYTMPRYSVYSCYSCGWQALTEALAWHHKSPDTI